MGENTEEKKHKSNKQAFFFKTIFHFGQRNYLAQKCPHAPLCLNKIDCGIKKRKDNKRHETQKHATTE